QPRGTILDVRPDERPVLVQGRPAALLVLDEGNRQVCAVLELAQEVRERAEHEAAKRMLQVGRADCHGFPYAPPRRNPVGRRRENALRPLLAAPVHLVAELVDLLPLSLNLLRAVGELLNPVTAPVREPRPREVVRRVRLGQRACALELRHGLLEEWYRRRRVPALEQPVALV